MSASISRLRRALGRYRLLLAVLTLVALSLIYKLVFGHGIRELVETAIPNAIAALFVFLAVYALYQFIGVTPSDEIAQLLDKQGDQLGKRARKDLEAVAAELRRLQIPRPRGILGFYPQWSEISGQEWESILSGARQLDIVMNWCDSLLESNSRTFRRLLADGLAVTLYLPHPGNFGTGDDSSSEDRAWLNQLADTYKMPRKAVRLRIAESVSQLLDLGARSEQVTVLLLRGLTYSAVRIDKSRLLVSHYDQFRVGHPRAHALLLDLGESPELRSYWADQFYRFESIAPTPVDMMMQLRRSLGNRGAH